MRLRISVVSVMVLTLFFSFLVQDDVKAQAVAGFCDRNLAVQTVILAVINTPEPPATAPDPAITCMTITAAQLAGITELTVSNVDINGPLASSDFADLDGLVTLNLNNLTNLGTLPEDVFDEVDDTLTTLDLSGNSISALNEDIFDGFMALTTLDLSGNSLTELPDGIFSGLTRLRGVDVSGNTTDPFTLTVRLKETSPNQMVVEVVEGVPFNVTADLEIDNGGRFSGTDMMPIRTARQTIGRGRTESGPIQFTVTDTTMMGATISITAVGPTPFVIGTEPETVNNISDSFNDEIGQGYSGFRFEPVASIPTLTRQMGICHRTQAVREAIVAALAVDRCDSLGIGALLRFVTDLDLSSGSITSLQSGDFAFLTGLETLDLSDNSLGASDPLPADIFEGLTDLTTLNLSGNDLTDQLPPSIFDELADTLTTLDLSNNDFEMLPDGIFDGLTDLTAVDVSGNPQDTDDSLTLTVTPAVTVDPYDTTGQDGMAVIEVVQGVPFAVTATVEIMGGEFSPSVTTMANVMISKGGTRSAAFPFTVSTDASSTTFTVTAVSTPGITNIADNYMEDTTSPGTFSGYSGFVLAGGSLGIDASICDRTLAVQTAILGQIPSLTGPVEEDCQMVDSALLMGITGTLNLSGQTIDTLMLGDFAGLTGLTMLDLSQNDLETLPAGIFNGLTALTTLNLSSNGETASPLTLNADIFDGLTSLERLDLSNNALSTLAGNIFEELDDLLTLRLNNNNLMTLPAGIFSGLGTLEGVDVSNNPGAPFTLIVAPTDVVDPDPANNTPGTAVIGVFQDGVPFVVPFEVRTTVEIEGGTFPGATNPREVVILKGATRSAPPFEFTLEDVDRIVTVSIISPDNTGSGFGSETAGVGYSGFELVGEVTQSICGRTDAVEAAILMELGFEAQDCAEVSNIDLMGITSLDLMSDLSPSGQDMRRLQSGDFAGLTGLQTLILSSNALEVDDLPEGIFSDLGALMTLDLSNNTLETLLGGIFSDLGALMTLDLSNNALTSLPEGVFAGLTMLTGVNASGNNPPDDSPDFTLTLFLSQRGNNFVVEVAEGAPTTLTVTVNIMVDRVMVPSLTARIETGMTESEVIMVTPAEVEVTFTLMNPMSDLTTDMYSGLVLEASSDPLTFNFREEEPEDPEDPEDPEERIVEERIERAGETILPTVSRELISGIQNVISGRIGRLATTPVINSPTAEVAGQSSFSDLLTFSAQTFDRVHNQGQSFAMETLLQETSFALSVNGEEEETSRTGFESIAVWGSADYQNVSGGDDISWDGSIISFHIGSDMRVTDEVLGGVSLSWSRGTFDYEDSTMGMSQEGEYELELLSFHPYGGWMPLPWLNLWASRRVWFRRSDH